MEPDYGVLRCSFFIESHQNGKLFFQRLQIFDRIAPLWRASVYRSWSRFGGGCSIGQRFQRLVSSRVKS